MCVLMPISFPNLMLILFLLQTRQLLVKYPGLVVYGTARNPDESVGLQALKRRHPVRCELAEMDVTKEDTIEVKSYLIIYMLCISL